MADPRLTVVLAAEDRFSRTFANLKRDIAAGQGQLQGLAAAGGLVSSALGRITFGAIGAGGFAAGVRQLANDLDALNDVSDATGDTVENLSALEDVARRNGAGLELVSTSISKLNKVLQEATPGSALDDALSRLGLNAAELRKAVPTDALQQFAVALNGITNDGDKARLVQVFLGRSLGELAPFLKDVAEAGKLNATVTSDQAAAAERFNKELAGLSTNIGNAARTLVADWLPAINRSIKDTNALLSTFGVLGSFKFRMQAPQFENGVEGLQFARKEVERLQAAVDNFQPSKGFYARFNDADRLKDLKTELDYAKQVFQYREKSIGLDSKAGAGRGTTVPTRAIGDTSNLGAQATAQRAQVSEAQRYLESLQKQGEKLDELTVTQQLLRDIEKGRIDGLTPGIEKLLRLEAQRIDLAKQLNAEKEREAGFQRLLTDKTQRDINEALGLLDQTPTGQRDRIARQTDLVLGVARQNPEDPRIQTQASEALTRLRKEMDDLDAQPEKVGDSFNKLADTIEKSMDRSTGAVLDFITEGKGGFNDLFSAFSRDILRDQIEQPLRDTMKSASKAISTELSKAFSGGGGGLFSSLFSAIGGAGSSLFGGLGSLLGFTGRANGGSVKAGQLVRWQESGREWFVPGSDGTVVNPAQQRAMGAQSAPVIHYAPVVHVNGDVSGQTIQLVQAMLARNNAQLARSMRTGGAFAQA